MRSITRDWQNSRCGPPVNPSEPHFSEEAERKVFVDVRKMIADLEETEQPALSHQIDFRLLKLTCGGIKKNQNNEMVNYSEVKVEATQAAVSCVDDFGTQSKRNT